MKKILCILVLIFVLCGCNTNNATNDNNNNNNNNNNNQTNDSGNSNVSGNGMVTTTYDNFKISSLNKDAHSKTGQTITFTKAGEYTVSGSFDGSLVFNVSSAESVTLFLENATAGLYDMQDVLSLR